MCTLSSVCTVVIILNASFCCEDGGGTAGTRPRQDRHRCGRPHGWPGACLASCSTWMRCPQQLRATHPGATWPGTVEGTASYRNACSMRCHTEWPFAPPWLYYAYILRALCCRAETSLKQRELLSKLVREWSSLVLSQQHGGQRPGSLRQRSNRPNCGAD